MKKIALSLLSLLLSFQLFAQDTTSNNEATGLRADGKIYVVIAILVTILLGFAVYVIRLDRKITRLEKKQD